MLTNDDLDEIRRLSAAVRSTTGPRRRKVEKRIIAELERLSFPPHWRLDKKAINELEVRHRGIFRPLIVRGRLQRNGFDFGNVAGYTAIRPVTDPVFDDFAEGTLTWLDITKSCILKGPATRTCRSIFLDVVVSLPLLFPTLRLPASLGVSAMLKHLARHANKHLPPLVADSPNDTLRRGDNEHAPLPRIATCVDDRLMSEALAEETGFRPLTYDHTGLKKYVLDFSWFNDKGTPPEQKMKIWRVIRLLQTFP